MGVRIRHLEFEALGSGITYADGGDDITFFDVDLNGKWHFLGGDDHLRGSIVVGWRQTLLELEYDDDGDELDFDIELGGPYFGLQLSL